MSLPLAPVAVRVLHAGALAAAGSGPARLTRARVAIGRTGAGAEDAPDRPDEGLAAHAPREAAERRNLACRFRRVPRGADGRGAEIDLAPIARARLRRA